MDWAQLILQLGISAVTLYILREALIRGDKRDRDNDVRIDERDQAFQNFVTEHNDEMTKMMVESTIAIRESSESMKESSKFIVAATQTMSEVRDHFIKGH